MFPVTFTMGICLIQCANCTITSLQHLTYHILKYFSCTYKSKGEVNKRHHSSGGLNVFSYKLSQSSLGKNKSIMRWHHILSIWLIPLDYEWSHHGSGMIVTMVDGCIQVIGVQAQNQFAICLLGICKGVGSDGRLSDGMKMPYFNTLLSFSFTKGLC